MPYDHTRERTRSGTTSGVTARELAESPAIGSHQPGKRNLVQTYEVGDAYIDRGAACDGERVSVGCFLEDKQRQRLVEDFRDCVSTAQTNYKDAIAELRVDRLLEKEEDLSWVLSLALDAVGAHLLAVVARALKTVRAVGVTRLGEINERAAFLGQYSDQSWPARAERMISATTDARIDGVTRSIFDTAKGSAKTGARAVRDHDSTTKKTATLAYLDELRDGCDVAFHAFKSNALANARDAELVVLWQGMQPEFHRVGAYKTVLAEKLQRFHRSGVTSIGRKPTKSRDGFGAPVLRDTRVVFVRDIHGRKTPWFQSVEADSDLGRIDRDHPEYPHANDPKHVASLETFGPSRRRGGTWLDRPVPEEFADVAIARSEQRWGPVDTIDDGYLSFLKSTGQNVENVRHSVAAPTNTPSGPGALPANSIFAPGRIPWGIPAGMQLPDDSIFAAAPVSEPSEPVTPLAPFKATKP
jgi:hypothetical protein